MLLPKIKKLVIQNPECDIRLDNETVSLFHKNDVLICGVFDGIAEKLACEHGLKFLHTKILLIAWGDFYGHGYNSRELCFRDNGEAYILSATASQTSGGEKQYDLEAKFYQQDVESFAKEWGGSFEEEMKQNKEFVVLMERARIKGGCYIDYGNIKRD